MKREMCGALLDNDSAPGEHPLLDDRLCDNDTPCTEHGTDVGEGIGIEGPAPKPCSLCGMTDGPYPNGDRPKTGRLQSGCPRCGWCY